MIDSAASARVVWFDELTIEDVGSAGGKGANLGELVSVGLPVPEGFVVTAEAYLEAMDVGGVRADLVDRVSTADADESSLARVAAELQDLVHKAGMTASLDARADRRVPALGRRSLRRGALVGNGRRLRYCIVRGDERDVHQRPRRGRAHAPCRRLLGVVVRSARVSRIARPRV